MRAAVREDNDLPCFVVEFDGDGGLCSSSAMASTKFEQRDRELPRGRNRISGTISRTCFASAPRFAGLYVYLVDLRTGLRYRRNKCYTCTGLSIGGMTPVDVILHSGSGFPSYPFFHRISMNPETKPHEGSSVYDTATKAIASLAPIGNIHQHLCSFHVDAYVVQYHRIIFIEGILVKTAFAMWRLTTSAIT